MNEVGSRARTAGANSQFAKNAKEGHCKIRTTLLYLFVMAADYTAAAARRIVKISQRCLDYWDQRGIVTPSGEKAEGKGSQRRYSYDDLLKLSVVKRLRQTGLSLQKIRKGLAKLRKNVLDEDPLLREVLVTDGKSLHQVTPNPAAVKDILAGGQLVFSVVAVGQIDQSLRESVVKIERKIASRSRPQVNIRRKAR
jgi:DNA-binding transcriptional MerR regulator